MFDGQPTGGDRQRSVSMAGLLAFLLGSGLLLGYWKFFGFAVNFNRFEHLAFVAVTSFLTLWGLKQLILAREPHEQRRTTNHPQSGRRNGRSASAFAWSISWVGILLILAGVELLLNPGMLIGAGLPATLSVIVGLCCILLGIRKIFATLRPGRSARRLTRAFTKPGATYLLVMTVMLVGSLLGHSNMLMLVFALMVGPFVLNGWITFSMLRRTNVSRRLPKTAIAGEPFSVDVKLENRKLMLASSVMMVADRIENAYEKLVARVLFSRVPARAAKTESYRICLMQRGHYDFGPLHLTTRFPLGFVVRGVVFHDDAQLLVYPRIGRLTDVWKRGRMQSAELVDRHAPLRGSFHDEFHAMRDYRAGDSPRSIHWRTSARRNELTVREHEQHRSQDLMLLLDLWRPERREDADREREELAISFAATLAADHVRHTRDARLEVAVSGREFGRWGGTTIDSLLEMLALIEAGTAPDLARLAAESEKRRAPSMRVLLLTTRTREADLLDAIGRLPSGGASASFAGSAEIVVAGPEELAPFFVFEPDDVPAASVAAF